LCEQSHGHLDKGHGTASALLVVRNGCPLLVTACTPLLPSVDQSNSITHVQSHSEVRAVTVKTSTSVAETL
jgi:hypothetical protein